MKKAKTTKKAKRAKKVPKRRAYSTQKGRVKEQNSGLDSTLNKVRIAMLIIMAVTILFQFYILGQNWGQYNQMVAYNKMFQESPQTETAMVLSIYLCADKDMGMATGLTWEEDNIILKCESGEIQIMLEGECGAVPDEMPCDEVIDGKCYTDAANAIDRVGEYV